MTAPCLAAALAYRARGWSVIAVEPRGKRPLVVWRAFQHRVASVSEVEGWYRRWPEANVGIVTGVVSGLVVVDIDARHGGHESLAQLEDVHGPLPDTVEAATGGGGRHLYYAHPDGGLHPNRVAMHPGIDLRGDGGCVVAPPSMHPSGRRYAWVTGHAPDDLPLAALPACFDPAPAPTAAPAHAGHPRAHWRQLMREGVVEGRRNATLASLTGHLLWRGVDPEVALELMLAWNRVHCRPPLPDDEVAQVVHSVSRLHEREFEADAASAPD